MRRTRQARLAFVRSQRTMLRRVAAFAEMANDHYDALFVDTRDPQQVLGALYREAGTPTDMRG